MNEGLSDKQIKAIKKMSPAQQGVVKSIAEDLSRAGDGSINYIIKADKELKSKKDPRENTSSNKRKGEPMLRLPQKPLE